MKKKKVMASLVLTAMMVGTLGTSVSATAWKPDGTNGVSSVGGQGGTSGLGVVQNERHEQLFLVAVPTTARQYRFYADPDGTSGTMDTSTFQFQREADSWVEWSDKVIDHKTNKLSENLKIPAGRENFSNVVAVYNAGSKNVTVRVDANLKVLYATNGSTRKDIENFMQVQVVSKKLTTADRLNPALSFGAGDFYNWTSGPNQYNIATKVNDKGETVKLTESEAKAAGHAIQTNSTTWEISLPGSTVGATNIDWLKSETSLTATGVKATKDVAVSLEEFNATEADANKKAEFKYPVALFALKGYTMNQNDPWWNEEMLARLDVKWTITDESNDGPSIESVVTITDLENGNYVPVSLGFGESARNVVSKVEWKVEADQSPSGVAFTQDLMASGQVKYEPMTATAGRLVFDKMALTTLNRYGDLNGATITVTFETPGKDPVEKTFMLWVY